MGPSSHAWERPIQYAIQPPPRASLEQATGSERGGDLSRMAPLRRGRGRRAQWRALLAAALAAASLSPARGDESCQYNCFDCTDEIALQQNNLVCHNGGEVAGEYSTGQWNAGIAGAWCYCECDWDNYAGPTCELAVVDCVGEWVWGPCSTTCGDGETIVTFSVSTAAENGGLACESADGETQTQYCYDGDCPVDVDCVGSWGEWGSCSTTCGDGSQTRMFSISTATENSGVPCDSADGETQTQYCYDGDCPVDVDCVGSWGEWGLCSATCGDGSQTRMFSISTAAENSGVPCDSADGETQTQYCYDGDCPVDVDCVGAWGEWGSCSTTCGHGTMTRTYTVTTSAEGAGSACEASDGDQHSLDCNIENCATVDACTASGISCENGGTVVGSTGSC
eukprot:COSAG05_NODE_1084_length_5930_cov_11.147316_8_plen_394_part_01